MEKDMVVHCCVLQVFCLFLVTNVYGTNPTSLTIPSFESSWYNIRAQNKDNTALKINHYLGEYPAFVDVQIKIPKNGKDFIFTGVGSAHRDDDTNNPYGGTVYIYNQIDIVLTFPLKNNDFETGGIAYTGSHKLYNGPSELEGPFMTGMVKVRAWRNSDMPKLQLNMSVYVDNGANSYREINHTLGFYPDIMSVRTHLANGYLSDAQGSVLESCLCHMGGVIYGYDHQKIRLWVRAGYATFTSVDGWAGSLPAFNNGSVEILAWTMDNFHRSFQKVFTVMKNCSTQSSLHFQEGLDLNNIFISTKVRISTGNSNNSGMEFNAVGSSMASGLNPYGGIVYAYTTDSIMFWIPKAEKGHLIYIGGIWGSGQQSESADVVDVNVVVYYLSAVSFRYPVKCHSNMW
ncbi:uncharacterized protein LOC143062118 isoform X2 [Mytilus galloprovincialis]|uniref:uncharacterized protein LOC143062118 isoform X2 n=1 Tax=Mytilus galloprovincialis TaxID=29158 RepID=UPI003F7CC3D7